MAIPGVTPTKTLMSLGEYDDQTNTGALIGLGGDAEARYRSSLSGQMAPIYGKGGYQYATLNPYDQVYSFNVNDYTTAPGMPVDQTSPTDQPDGGSSFDPARTLSGTVKTAQNLVQQPTSGTSQYGPITGMVQDYIGDANIDVPFVGNVNVPNAAVNTVLDTAFNFGVPGLGILSTIANPTQVETSWGVPFNTGGGGLIGVMGQLSLNNLENIYSESEKGTEGYNFFAPGDIDEVSTPIGLSPGLFGYTVVSGNTDYAIQQNPFLDSNKDGTLSASEIQEYAEGGKNYNAYLENKAFKENVQETLIDMVGSTGIKKTFDAKGNPTGTTFQSGNLITDATGKIVGSLPPGMTRAEFADALEANQKASTAKTDISENVTTTTTPDLTTQSIVDAITKGMENAKANPNVPGTVQVASAGNIVSDAGSSKGDDNDSQPGSGISVGYGEGKVDPGLAAAVGKGKPATSAADYNAKDGTTPSSKGDGGGSGDKIVCTEMYRQTGLDDWAKAMKVWDVYQKKHLTQFHEIGYHWLFKPYVKGMRKSNSMTKLGAYLAKERTQHLKHVLTKGRAKDSIIGNIWCKIIHPVVYVAGKIKKES